MFYKMKTYRLAFYEADPDDYDEMSRRIFGMAAMIPEGRLIGFEFRCGTENEPEVLVFSDSEMDQHDLAWAANDCAKAIPADDINLPDAAGEGRRQYIVLAATDDAGDGRNTVLRQIMKSGMLRLVMKSDLILRIIAGPDAQNGFRASLLISCPGEMPLRLRVAFAAFFPGSVLADTAQAEHEGPIGTSPCGEDMIPFAGSLFDMAASYQAVPQLTAPAVMPGETAIEDLSFSIRTYNCLKRAGIHTLGELRRVRDEDLRKIRNLGKKNIAEIHQKLKEAETPLEMVLPDPFFEESDPERPMDMPETPQKADPMVMLDELVGLDAVKAQVRKITALARMKQDLAQQGRAAMPINLSMAFVGNPGTAKTTVARILAGIFKEIGLLESDELIEAGRADLIARYEGQTAEKVKDVFKRAEGRLLFIDEAYALLEDVQGAFGDEAINTIVQEMENRREKTIVIFAGYPEEMARFLDRNPGLSSRVPFRIAFSDYSAAEMVEITRIEAARRGFTIEPGAEEKLQKIFGAAADDPAAGNGRLCRNLAESAVLSYAARVYGDGEAPCGNSFALTRDDFTAPERAKAGKNRIGFFVSD